MKLLSEACEYAIRAVVYLAQRPGQTHKVRNIAEGTCAAPGYLVKVLQNLAKAGIVSTQRGSTGGFALLRDPASLSVLEIVNAVDPIERIRSCPLGLENHGASLCAMHRRIDDAVAGIEASFSSSTVLELLSGSSPSMPLCDRLSTSVFRAAAAGG